MLHADRCDLLQLGEGKNCVISHEWRETIRSRRARAPTIPIDAKKLGERFDITKPIRINDVAKSKDATLKFFAKAWKHDRF